MTIGASPLNVTVFNVPGWIACSITNGQHDGDSGDGEVGHAEIVRDAQADLVCPPRHVQCLTDGGVEEGKSE